MTGATLPSPRPSETASKPAADAAAANLRLAAQRVHQSVDRGHASSLVWVQLDSDRSTAVKLIELAEALSRVRDETVLMIDADVRRRQVTAELGLQADAGLAEYLGVGRPATSLVKPRLRERLDVLPAGRGWLGNARRLLPSIADLLERVGRHRLVTVVGGPPEDPLTAAFVRSCHASILIVQSGVTEKSRATAALPQVARRGGRLLGALVA